VLRSGAILGQQIQSAAQQHKSKAQIAIDHKKLLRNPQAMTTRTNTNSA